MDRAKWEEGERIVETFERFQPSHGEWTQVGHADRVVETFRGAYARFTLSRMGRMTVWAEPTFSSGRHKTVRALAFWQP
jgi:hypothetical protein